MNKRDKFIGECIDYTHDGLGVVKQDNTTIFVKNLLLHEVAEIEVIKVLKSYCVGRVVELKTPSSERIEPKCECFKQCGGCSLMHMSDCEQQSFKTNRVKETFLKIAHQDLEVNDCLMDMDPYHYRNKVQVPFGKKHVQTISLITITVLFRMNSLIRSLNALKNSLKSIISSLMIKLLNQVI